MPETQVSTKPLGRGDSVIEQFDPPLLTIAGRYLWLGVGSGPRIGAVICLSGE